MLLLAVKKQTHSEVKLLGQLSIEQVHISHSFDSLRDCKYSCDMKYTFMETDLWQTVNDILFNKTDTTSRSSSFI